MRTSLSDNGIYPHICERASNDDTFFNNFKKDQSYKQILEHVSYELGISYLEVIKRDNIEMLKYIEKFKENDIYGNPDTFHYNDIDVISPTTLRYIKVLSDLKNLIGDLTDMRIVEIGGGYGGQCKIVSDYYNLSDYLIVDLDSALKLIEKYLNKLELNNFRLSNMNNLVEDKYDLVISNYAFTELHRSIQDVYVEKIINNSKHGYMMCNIIGGIETYTKDELLNLNKNVKLIKEEPLTHSNNFTIYW